MFFPGYCLAPITETDPTPEVAKRASTLDREADALLFLGRHAAAERLSHQADAMRQVAP
jgi:hypothetical protein